MRILVTGGAGYIGAHACKAIARAGHEPIVFDNLSTGHRQFVRWGPLETGDIRDEQRLNAVFALHRPEFVMHFAALAHVADSVRDPALYHEVNVGGTRTLLSVMLRHGLNRIVFSSSCAVYGIAGGAPVSEGSSLAPISPYGHTKLAAERMMADFEADHGVGWVALRYANAAGGDPEREVGEWHDPETHVIPLALEAALGMRPEFHLFGDDYPTRDGSAVRDYVHVTDLADAHVRALAYLAQGGASGAFNLSTGAGASVREVIAAIERVSGRKVPLVTAPRRPGDPPELSARATLAGQALGWRPRHSGLDEIVATALDWIERRRAGKTAFG